MKELIEKIITLSESRVQEHMDRNDEGFFSSDVHKKWFLGEVEEAIEEIKDNNTIYLEDELGDVFWTYCNLLNGLKKEGKITNVEKVFERTYEKFSQRVEYSRKSKQKVGVWDDIKIIQKKKLKNEHEEKYGINK